MQGGYHVSPPVNFIILVLRKGGTLTVLYGTSRATCVHIRCTNAFIQVAIFQVLNTLHDNETSVPKVLLPLLMYVTAPPPEISCMKRLDCQHHYHVSSLVYFIILVLRKGGGLWRYFTVHAAVTDTYVQVAFAMYMCALYYYTTVHVTMGKLHTHVCIVHVHVRT